MTHYASRAIRYCSIGLACSVSTFAFAGTPQSGLSIGDKDSVYIDAKTFQLIPAKAKGDAAKQLVTLGARDLGPGAIIMRSGDKLYIVDTDSLGMLVDDQGVRKQAYDPSIRNQAYDPGIRNQAYDPGIRNQAYNPGIRNQAYDPGIRNQAYDPGIRNQAYDPGIRNQAYDPGIRNQAYDPGIRNQAYDPGIRNQAYDPSIRNQASAVNGADGVYIYDPDYVEYRLKKLFAEHWTPIGAN